MSSAGPDGGEVRAADALTYTPGLAATRGERSVQMRLILPFLSLVLILLAPPAAAQLSDDDSSSYRVFDDDDSGAVMDSVDSGDPVEPAEVGDAFPDVSDAEAEAALATLMDADGAGWAVVAAAILSLAVFFGRKTGALSFLPKHSIPWVAALAAMLGEFLGAVIGGEPVPAAVARGFLIGSGAVAFWELALKHGLKSTL